MGKQSIYIDGKWKEVNQEELKQIIEERIKRPQESLLHKTMAIKKSITHCKCCPNYKKSQDA